MTTRENLYSKWDRFIFLEPEAFGFGQSIFEYAPRSRGAATIYVNTVKSETKEVLGNQNVQRLIKSGHIMAKLVIDT
jgi:hypothetical protein